MPAALGSSVAPDGLRVELTVADHNRARWARVALSGESKLVKSLYQQARRSGTAQLIDSISLLRSGVQPALGSHVLLWDGFNSYLELREQMPSIASRSDLRFAVVGWLPDLTSLYPSAPLPVFEDGCDEGGFRFSRWSTSVSRLRTLMRSRKNALIDRDRHRALSGEPKLVFCGLVRPAQEAVLDLSRRMRDEMLRAELLALGDAPLGRNDASLSERVRRMFGMLRERKQGAPEAVASSYTVLAVLHRCQTLSRIAAMCDEALFINEFGRDRHFDPYDSPDYRQHVYLDFGSTRGVELRYPRSIDLGLNAKQFLPLRLLWPHERLSDFLDRCDAGDFIALCEQHAEQARARLAAVSRDSALRPSLEQP